MLARVMLLCSLLWALPLAAQPLNPESVPEDLLPWVDWALHEHPEIRCPVRHADDERQCVWAGRLDLDVSDRGGAFAQQVTVFTESRVALPGDTQQWPVDVRIDGEPAQWVESDGRPAVLLTAGEHVITGRFEWQRAPESLAVNPQTGLVQLRRDGRAEHSPTWREGRLWLRPHTSEPATATPEDSLRLQVSRRIADGHPLTMTTHLKLEVAGSPRELVLGNPVNEGFTPMAMSAQLPARIDPDGQLRVQVRPGTFFINVTSRDTGITERIAFATQPAPWPEQEAWAFQASPADRIVDLQGPPQVDPRRTHLPQAWQNLPAYQMQHGQVLLLRTERRGNPDPEPDQLSLARELWLDSDGAAYSVRDQIRGSLTRTWRLDAGERLRLGQVQVDGQPQFITENPNHPGSGVELRRGRVNLTADGRIEGSIRELPVPGWMADFREVSATLHTPPGWRVLAVTGADNVPGAWIERWTLFDLFFVLLLVIAVARLWGIAWAVPAALAMLLSWHEPDAPHALWLALLAIVALLRVVPRSGRVIGVLRIVRLGLLLLLALQLLPFMVDQARQALYPQLASDRHLTDAPMATMQAGAPTLDTTAGRVEEEVASGVKRARKAYGSSPPSAPAPALEKLVEVQDPKAIIQTGQGLPDWRWQSTALRWNGPVRHDQSIELYLLSPLASGALRWLGILLLVLLAWRLLDIGKGSGNPPPANRAGPRFWVAAALTAYAGGAAATPFPPAELLDQLAKRLLVPDTAAPRASLPSMDLDVQGDTMTLTLSVQTLQQTAVPLPFDPATAVPMRIEVDGVAAGHRVLRTPDSQLWLLLEAGTHQVQVSTTLATLDQVPLPLALRPMKVSAQLQGWTLQGLDARGVPGKQLNLIRTRATDTRARELSPGALPAFLRIERTLQLGLQWEVRTIVRRMSPPGQAIAAQVPLLAGESVITADMPVSDGRIQVALGPRQTQATWTSTLEPVERLSLTAGSDPLWLEQWALDVAPIWHVAIEGLSPIHHQDDQGRWLPTWHPWPGESVNLSISRPGGSEGRTLTIDKSDLTVSPGLRATEATLAFQLRSSQGGRHTVTLPAQAQLQWVRINGQALSIRPEEGKLSLPVSPGEQKVEMLWRNDEGISARWRSPAPELGIDHVNARLQVRMPADRWLLWVSGPQMGPAVLFWGMIAVLLIVAAALGAAARGRVPLGMLSWVLLGLGLSQVSVLAVLPVAAWLFLLHHRGTLDGTAGKWHFNLVQLGILFLSLVTLVLLFHAVQTGLLQSPDMQISGNGSSQSRLNWYQDRSPSAYPVAQVVSVPMLAYRLLMLLWALWLAFSLLRWLRWGWQAFSRGGLWRSIQWNLTNRRPRPATASAAPPPAPPGPAPGKP